MAEAKAGKKQDVADQVITAAQDAPDAKRRNEAKDARIRTAVGMDAKDPIGDDVALHPNQIPEDIAVKVGEAMIQAFERMGTIPGGARLAAQQVAVQAGFRVATQQLAAPRREPRNQARPKPGRRPTPKPKAVGKPIQKAPVPNPAPAQRARPTLPEIHEESDRRRAAQAPSGAPGALAKAVGLISKTQDAASKAQIAEQAILTRLALLEQRQARIDQNAVALNNWAREQAPSAINSGSSTA